MAWARGRTDTNRVSLLTVTIALALATMAGVQLLGGDEILAAFVSGMTAQLLGARLQGDPREIFVVRSGMGQGPFHVVFDELAYYPTSGMDRMLAMGRGLNMMFWLSFQEEGGIWARLGEKTYSLLSNANLTIAMR